MKAFVCEMCNSQDLVRQDGFYVCQSCGTKYTIEEAKKLMVEIEGAVKIDNSDFVEKYLQNARRAIAKEDWAEVEKYSNMVEQNDPDNIEAIFYSAYGKAKQSLVEEDIYKREAVFKVLIKSVSVLDDNFAVAKADELIPILSKIGDDVVGMFNSEFVFSQKKDQYGNVTWTNKPQTYQLFINLAAEQFKTLTNIVNKFPADDKAHIAQVDKLRLKVLDIVCVSTALNAESRRINAEKALNLVARIKSMDPGFTCRDYNAVIAEIDKQKRNGVIGVIIALILSVVVGILVFNWVSGLF